MQHHRVISSSLSALLAFVASSCSTGVDMTVRSDHSASVALSVEVPPAIETKLRQFSTSASPQAMFDAAAIASSVADRGIAVRESSSPDSRSWRGAFNIIDLEKLLASDRDLASVLSFSRGPGWASVQLRIDRANAPAIVRLFPGLDVQLLEALQPPALYDNPVNAAEYRTMLSGLLGKAAVAALDNASFVLTSSFPGAIMESSGGLKVDAARKTASLAIPAIEVMVLEQPVVFSIRWKE
jgi:hypothetical protein